jgi:hypothetical protein
VAIARAAKAAGAQVEIVGKVGEDAAGGAVLIDLATAGIGHVAILRDAGRATGEAPPAAKPEVAPFDDLENAPLSPAPSEPSADPPTLDAADVELALRYLPDYRVVVVAQPLADPALHAAAAAARWANAALVVIVRAGSVPPASVGADATVIEAPAADPDDAFARIVGEYAAALDRGDSAADAFAAASSGTGWTMAGED